MVYLYRRCMEHMTSQWSQHHLSAFWETHYALEKAIHHCRNKLLSRHIIGDSSDDPRSLALRMNLAAVEISLHETALLKAQKDKPPPMLADVAVSKCISGAAEIADVVQLMQRLTGEKIETFRRHDLFLIWPMTLAIQLR